MKNFGKLIYGGGSLTTVHPATVRIAVARHGFLLLRGFSSTEKDYEAFCRKIAPRHVVVAGRRSATASGRVHFSDGDTQHLRLHAENSFSPLRPDVASFYCQNPAAEDGQTTVADGVQVLALLSPRLRQLFTSVCLRWTTRLRTEALEQVYGRSDRPFMESLARAISTSMDPRIERFECEFQHDVVTYHYESMAVSETVRGLAYADSCTNFTGPEPSEFGANLKTATVAFADGTALTDEMQQEIEHAKDDVAAIPIDWCASDVLVLDNWSMLHGRNAFWGGRRILCYFGYADWLRPSRRAYLEESALAGLAVAANARSG